MNVAAENGLVFNSTKCHIKLKSITFFGNTYSDKGVQPDNKKVSDLKAMPAPSTKKKLQEFLGFVTYLSPFIHNLADKSAPLRDLTKQDVPFMWEDHHQRCFDKLKQTVTDDSTLQYFDTSQTPVLQTDASLKGLGATLLQNGKPVAYASKSLSDTETRYACIERELLAIVFGMQRFHTYLYGRKFKVITDHKPLVMIRQKPLTRAPPRLQRMMLKLQGYQLDIEYRPGREMTLADTLSRLPNARNGETIDLDVRVDLVKFSTDRLNNIRDATKRDSTLNQLSEIITTGWPESIKEIPNPVRAYWSYRDELSIDNGIVLKGPCVVIPGALQQEILEQLHYGHQGIEKTCLRARDTVFWNGINKDIESLVKKCSVCQEHQPMQTQETLLPHEIPNRPWEVVGTDLFYFDGSEYLIADYYSKFPIIRKLPVEYTSKGVIDHTKQIFSEHGIPNRVISDNGPQYSSELYREFAKEWCFDHVTSSPRFPQSNGFVERQIRTVKSLLSKAKQSGTDVHMAILCLRTTPVSQHLPSPGELLTGRKLRGNVPVRQATQHRDSDHIREQLQKRQETQKVYHDRTANDLSPLMPGQSVTVQDHRTNRWMPVTIASKCDEPRSYIVESPSGSTLRRNRMHIRESPDTPTVKKRVTFAVPVKHVVDVPERGQLSNINNSDPNTTSDRTRPTEMSYTPEQTEPGQTTTTNKQSTTVNIRSEQCGNAYKTRSGRVVKAPDKYKQ